MLSAVVEVSDGVPGMFDFLKGSKGRPMSQLHHIRAILEKHEAGCYECQNSGAV